MFVDATSPWVKVAKRKGRFCHRHGKEKQKDMITKFEKQVVALFLAATVCFVAVLSCGVVAYATEAESAAEVQTGGNMVSDEMQTATSVEESDVTSGVLPVVISAGKESATSAEEAAGEPIATSTEPDAETPAEEVAGEPTATSVETELDAVDNLQSVVRVATASEGAYEYEALADDTVVVSKYNGTETEVSVPEMLGGKNVSSIGESAFAGNDTIAKVTLPATVTSIQYFSFGNCTNLKNVELSGNNLKTIGRQAFWASGLTKFVAPSVETVGMEAFHACSDLDSVVFGTQLKSLGEYAFLSSGLRSIEISESNLTRIEEGTFWSCNNLSRITLPNGLKSIGIYAFSFSGLETIKLPDSVEEIEEKAFCYCGELETAELSKALKKIGEHAFSYSGLVAIEIPDSVEEVGYAAFYECQKLASATIGNGVTVMGAEVFANCALTTVTIGERVEVIYDQEFAGNRELSKVVIPQNVTRMEYAAFRNCEALADIIFPDSLTKIDGWALDGTSWYAGQADGMVYAGKVAYHYKGDMPAETSVKLQDGTKGIAGFAFYECKNLKEIEIPKGVTNIGRFAFYDAGPMSSVRIPVSVTEIGQMALGYFSSLKGTSVWVDNLGYRSVEKIPDFTIYGQTGSAAQRYAQENGFLFVAEDSGLEIVLDVTDKVYLIGSGGNAVIKCTGELKDFVSVAVDGQIVDASCYTASEGSTVLTFLSSYLDKLSVGDHVVTLNYTYGSIDTVLTILDRDTDNAGNTNQNGNTGNVNRNSANGTPKTGDATPLYVMCLLFLCSGAGILVFIAKRKKGIGISY